MKINPYTVNKICNFLGAVTIYQHTQTYCGHDPGQICTVEGQGLMIMSVSRSHVRDEGHASQNNYI